MQAPVRVKFLETAMDAFKIWDNHLTKCIAPGCLRMSEEEKVGVSLREMPLATDQSIIR